MEALNLQKSLILQHSTQILKEIFKQLISDHLECSVQLITEQNKEEWQKLQQNKEDQWKIIFEENNKITIPIGEEKSVKFYLEIEHFDIDLLSFYDEMQKQWRFGISQVQRIQERDFLAQIQENQNKHNNIYLLNSQKQLIYMYIGDKDLEEMIKIPKRELNFNPIDIEELIYESNDFKQIILNQIMGLKDRNVSCINFNHSHDTEIQLNALKGEENQILNYWILVQSQKKKKKSIQEKNQFGLGQENIQFFQDAIKNKAKIEKITTQLIEILHLEQVLNQEEIIQTIINQVQLKVVDKEVYGDFDLQSLKNSYAQEYFKKEDLPYSIGLLNNQALNPNQHENKNTIKSSQSLQFENELSGQNQILYLKPDDLESLKNWNFDILQVGEINEKIRLIWAMFHLCHFTEIFNIETEKFYSFLVIAEDKYNHNKNPFHYFDHCFNVTHSMFYMIKIDLFQKYQTDLEQFIMLLSCLGHDLDHTGRSNAFEVSKKSKLALRYNDESVLENHHVSLLFKILKNPDADILSNFSTKDFQRIRKFVISNILWTDMKNHFQVLKDFDIKVQNHTNQKIPLFSDNPTERDADVKFFQGFMVHSCDLSGPAKKFEIAKIWSLKISQEFTNQVKEEEKLGLPVTVHMKGLETLEIVAKQEVAFIKIIIRPVWSIMNHFSPEKMGHALNNCDQNILKWQQTYEEEMNKRKNQQN